MIDITSLSQVTGFLRPEIMIPVHILTYVILLLFFGYISLIGYRGYLKRWQRLVLTISSGAVCLFGAIWLSPLIPFLDNLFMQVALMDVVIGGLISSVIMLAIFYIISFRFSRIRVIKKKVEKLQAELDSTRDRVPSSMAVDPLIIVGIIIAAVFIGFSIANFTGFPTLTERLFAQTNLTFEGRPITDQSQNCIEAMASLVSIQGQIQDPQFLMDHLYENEDVKSVIEGESGKTVTQMLRITEGGREVIIALTDDEYSCLATPDELCTCVSLGS